METTQIADQRSGANGPSEPSHDAIAARAFAIYLEEGQPEGRAWDHWLQAEKLVREERRSANWTPAQVETDQNAEVIESASQEGQESDSLVAGLNATPPSNEQRKSKRASGGQTVEHVGAA